jgi:uncharacterized delta-60 repeat protein
MKNYLFFIIILFNSALTLSQVTTVWEKRFNGPGNGYDEATSIAIDNSGNIYIAGASTGNGTGKDFALVKYNSSGDLLWSAIYNGIGNGNDDAYLVKTDLNGNVYISGASTGSSTGLDYAVVKFNSSGTQQWVYRYNGPGNATDEVYSLQADQNGNVYLTGYSNGGATGDDICTIKLNSDGMMQWVKRYNGTANNDDYGNSIQIDNSGNCYVTGASTQTGNDLDYITFKIDAAGNQVWSKTYNGPVNRADFPSSNAIDAAGNIYVTGYSYGSTNDPDYYTIKYNNSGVQQWAKRYEGPDGWDEAWNIILDPSGNVYVTGNSAGVGTGDDYCTIKYNNTGTEQWVARYTGTGASNDYCNWVAPDANGNVYVTGIVGDGAGNPQNIVTIGYNSAGVQQWVQTYNGSGNEFDSGNALTVDNQGNVYVTGGSDNPSNTDFITIRYSSTIGIQQLNNEIPVKFELMQNYPNPFNPSTKIRFALPVRSQVNLSVFDITGKKVSELVNGNLNAGIFETSFDASQLSSGTYFYSLTSGSNVKTNKMIILK